MCVQYVQTTFHLALFHLSTNPVHLSSPPISLPHVQDYSFCLVTPGFNLARLCNNGFEEIS